MILLFLNILSFFGVQVADEKRRQHMANRKMKKLNRNMFIFLMCSEKRHLKSAGVVIIIIFRYLNVPFADGFINIFFKRLLKDIAIKLSSQILF